LVSCPPVPNPFSNFDCIVRDLSNLSQKHRQRVVEDFPLAVRRHVDHHNSLFRRGGYIDIMDPDAVPADRFEVL